MLQLRICQLALQAHHLLLQRLGLAEHVLPEVLQLLLGLQQIIISSSS
jgi:hypothetical protein